ncbi:Vacuolar protein-sorting-associated protein 36 [Coemansia sp. RSA 1722]|nr:Vacuolar protein-sorting-associated protein 36 [Coemansia sp. RSA 485]KAJ2592302.1 Vacuolar protein-sorting-associated protein 36 [Coemansia sp. RSA 1722]
MNPAELGPTQRPLLKSTEKIICIQNKVGLYEGNQRDEEHDCGTLYLTTHRLFYVDQQRPRERSLVLELSSIDRCTLHGGFLYTSSKIHVYLKPKSVIESGGGGISGSRGAHARSSSGTILPHGIAAPEAFRSQSAGPQSAPGSASGGHAGRGQQQSSAAQAAALDWKCTICENVNKGGTKCTLCGVPRQNGSEEVLDTDSSHMSALLNAVGSGAAELTPIRCPTCTFDNHGSMKTCEMCDTELPQASDNASASTGTGTSAGAGAAGSDAASTSTPQYPRLRTAEQAGAYRDADNFVTLIKLSFRGGGAATFFAPLKEGVSNSVWLVVGYDDFGEPPQAQQQQQAQTLRQQPAVAGRDRRAAAGGISTIVSAAHATQRARENTVRSAFLDLDALTEKANEIISMAEHIATQLNSPAASKLQRKGGAESDEDSAERVDAFRQYLLDLGIDSPVTRDTAGAVFHDELARELCDYLENYVSQSGGAVALVDAYCLYNRAREFSLVYPADFVQACEKFEALQLPLRLREYPSGLRVLEDAGSASDALIVARINNYIASFGPITANDLAAIEDCALNLAEERLWLCERAGELCRDESVEGVRFYANLFMGVTSRRGGSCE